ncbi:MAG TPA: hypothetical protein VIN08_03385 [Ohtaekwangia sp.]|uniref:hypothetical protein n=1 Tax=Ohtaekwangia sp. TaxID=2066019 RepID=UPI002F938DB8
MKRAIDFLRSEVFIFLTLLLVITSQIIHTMYLFETVRVFDLSFEIASYKVTVANWVHAFIFALAIESAILMFILNGKPTPSKVYAVASFATNLLYYKIWMVPLPTIFASVLISSMLAGSIWFFSDLLAEKININTAATSKEEDELKKILVANDEVKKINFKTTMPMNGR